MNKLQVIEGQLTLKDPEKSLVYLYCATKDGIRIFSSDPNSRQTWELAHSALPGSFVSTMTFDHNNPGTIYAAIHDGGIFRSEDFGETWSEKSSGLTNKDVWDMSLSHDSKQLYVGTLPAALFRSNDSGDSWERIESFDKVDSASDWWFPSPALEPHTLVVAVDPRDSSRIYAGVEQGGFYRSDDMGDTWKDAGSGLGVDLPLDPHNIALHPKDPEIVYLAHGDGVYVSNDHGDNFRQINQGLTEWTYMSPLAINAERPELIFTASGRGTPPTWVKSPNGCDAGIFRSRNGGESWDRVRSGFPETLRGNATAIALDPKAGSSFVYVGTTDGEVYQSPDEGDNWVRIISGIPPIIKKTWITLLKK